MNVCTYLCIMYVPKTLSVQRDDTYLQVLVIYCSVVYNFFFLPFLILSHEKLVDHKYFVCAQCPDGFHFHTNDKQNFDVNVEEEVVSCPVSL